MANAMIYVRLDIHDNHLPGHREVQVRLWKGFENGGLGGTVKTGYLKGIEVVGFGREREADQVESVVEGLDKAIQWLMLVRIGYVEREKAKKEKIK